MKIQIINKSKHALPQYATALSAGMDLRANIDTPILLKPMQRKLVPTGLYIALPEGFEAQIRPRSGLALKKGITLLNTPGTIDADYRGEIGVIVVNLSEEDFIIEDGERIAQMVIARYEKAEWEEVELVNAENRISAVNAGIYPPSVPVLLAGEWISRNHIKYIINTGSDTFGISGGKIKVVKNER